MKTIKCKLCKKEFMQSSNSQKYCSKECYEKIEASKRHIYYLKYYKLHKKEISNNRKKNKKHYTAITLKYHKTHREIIHKIAKKYYETHKQKLIEYQRLYAINRRKTDINFKLAKNIKNRIKMALKCNYKAKRIVKLIGCSIKFLKNYIESQFKKGMSWKNYGKWHIDHIRPCCTFNLSKPNEQRKCFHYTNLQPLWAKENLSKGRK
jgi:hypothetical protein